MDSNHRASVQSRACCPYTRAESMDTEPPRLPDQGSNLETIRLTGGRAADCAIGESNPLYREADSNCPPPPSEGAARPTERSRLGSCHRLGKQELNLRILRSERSDFAGVVYSPIQRSRHDLNVQPPDSKSGALIQLSYESNQRCAPRRIRTFDLALKRRLLCRLSYGRAGGAGRI
jgi:hypothetical protein